VLALVLAALAAAPEPSLAQKLQSLSQARVFVAHQSVGQNVLDGVSVLAHQHGVSLRIEEGRGPLTAAGIVHAPAGKDGAPLAKLADFAALLEGGPGAGAQVALLELSYADVTADTDVDALFAAFKQRHHALKLKFPGVKFLVATVGLTTVQRGLQGLVKNRLASGAFGERENVKRHQLNQLLRKQYAGALFDLAAVEAGRCTFEREGEQWPCLREELTDDGGHLNALGRKEAGRAFVDAVVGAL